MVQIGRTLDQTPAHVQPLLPLAQLTFSRDMGEVSGRLRAQKQRRSMHERRSWSHAQRLRTYFYAQFEHAAATFLLCVPSSVLLASNLARNSQARYKVLGEFASCRHTKL